MGMVLRSGLMVRYTKVSERTTRLMGLGNFCILTEMYTRVDGRMIRLTGKECIYMLMGLGMRVSGRMIYRMDTDRKSEMMVVCTLGFMYKGKNMDWGFISEMMGLSIMGNGWIIKLVGMEGIRG
mmetsp:Transcript_11082/g.1662  ORF Transcript_11082/g.1662 Transcript_11082/m.1662 type:complete len:124 (+) Transcript_11082:391-762(+)